MRRLPLPLLLAFALSVAAASPLDVYPLISKDGVFRASTPLPARQTPADSKARELTPRQFGGEWHLTLTGPKTLVTQASFAYIGGKQDFATFAPAVAKLSARLAATLGTNCFNLAPEYLPALRGWVEERVRSGVNKDHTSEKTFGPVQVKLLSYHTDGDAPHPSGLVELDMLLSRKGTPGQRPWVSSCQK